MAQPYLTEYLLLLASDSNELTKFNKATKDERKKLGHDHGLSPTQADDLANADTQAITNDVNAEWPPTAGGTHYTIQLTLVLQPCKKPG